jgi:hypothetical protein
MIGFASPLGSQRKIMRQQKFTPRADYRLQESIRTKESVSLAQRYSELKSLTVEFAHFNAQGVTRNNQVKYTVNPEHAKSVFRLDCPNHECVRGDFDLSEALAQAIARKETVVTNEMRCEGWLSKTTIDQVQCRNILRYKLLLGY